MTKKSVVSGRSSVINKPIKAVRWQLGYNGAQSFLQKTDDAGKTWHQYSGSGMDAGYRYCELRTQGYAMVFDDRIHPVLSRLPGADTIVVLSRDGEPSEYLGCRRWDGVGFRWESPAGAVVKAPDHWRCLDPWQIGHDHELLSQLESDQ